MFDKLYLFKAWWWTEVALSTVLGTWPAMAIKRKKKDIMCPPYYFETLHSVARITVDIERNYEHYSIFLLDFEVCRLFESVGSL